MLFCQQFLIRGIAIEHDGILQMFSQFSCALLITFNQLNAVLLLQPLRQAKADITAADQHNAFMGFSSRCISLITARIC